MKALTLLFDSFETAQKIIYALTEKKLAEKEKQEDQDKLENSAAPKKSSASTENSKAGVEII